MPFVCQPHSNNKQRTTWPQAGRSGRRRRRRRRRLSGDEQLDLQ